MLRKSMMFLLPMLIFLAFSAWASEPVLTPTTVEYLEIKNFIVPTTPSSGIDDTDSTLFYEDFESGIGDWTTVDLTASGNMWHIDDYNGYMSTLSWWCGDSLTLGYGNHWLQYMISPELNFSSVTNPILSFKMYYSMENPAGATAPYDGWDGCNVWASANGGATWFVLTPDFPAYTSQSLYSFGDIWGMGPNIPGWTGESGGWIDAQFDLSAAAGFPSLTIRFTLCSDDFVTAEGFWLDEISIDDGATNLLYNDADGPAYPAEFTFDQGGTSGDYWTWTDQSQHSGSYSMLCDHENHYSLSDALITPWLAIPENVNVKFKFWLWCNMLDFDGDGDNILEDYYHVDVTTDGANWEDVFYDYGDIGRPGPALVGWEEYLPGMPFNGNIEMSLSAYGGQDIQLRWRVITDDNDDGGIGDGLYIDDFELFITGADNDVGADNIIVPMPTSAYFDMIHCSVELHNYGNLDQTMVPAFWRVNQGISNPLAPWASIPVLSFVTKEWDWETPVTGDYFIDAFTALGTDEDLSNDTSNAGTVQITAEDILEFGYDGRQYSWEPSVFLFNYETGEGTYVRYTPEDDGLSENLDGIELKGLFSDAGTIRIHIYEAGTASAPGPEVTNWDATVNVLSPAWQTFPLEGISYLQDNLTDFWVFFEVLNDLGTPHLLGWDQISLQAEGHFFSDFGSGMGPSDYDFFTRAVFSPSLGVGDPGSGAQPHVFALHQNTPNPFNPTTSIEFSLAKAGSAKLTVFDLMGRSVAVLVDGYYNAGVHGVEFNAGNLASGVYVYRLESDGKTSERKMVFLK